MAATHNVARTVNSSRSVTIEALMRASTDFGADPIERLALFEAAIVASDLDPNHRGHQDRVGVLAQDPSWGPAAARRDAYAAATAFLRQVRRIRALPGAPRTAGGLAARAQGGRTWRYRAAHWTADGIITGAGRENLRRWVK